MAIGPRTNNEGINLSPVNDTGFTPTTLVLIGIPGLEKYHIWFAAPLSAIYMFTLLGNTILLMAIKTVQSLHKPMYLLISQLAISDLTMSSSILPKMLSIFWFDAGEIYLSNCLVQLFFSYCCLLLESSILSTMALDRYVAVCNPLKYSAIITTSLIGKLAAATLFKAVVLIAPLPLFILRQPFCSRYVAHSTCENMALARLSCADNSLSSTYALCICVLTVPADIVCIVLSYIRIINTILNLEFKKDRSKAFGTCSSHICVMSAFYVPFFFSTLLYRLPHNIPLYVHVIVSNVGYLFSPLINPLIYGVTMKEVRLGVYQVLKKFNS